MSRKIPLFLVALGFVACGGSSGSGLFQGGTGPGAGGSSGGSGSETGGAPNGGSSTGGLAGTGGDSESGGAFGNGGAAGGAVGAGGTAPEDAGPTDPPVECPPRAFSGTATGTNYATVIGPMSVSANITFSVTKTGDIIGTYTGTQPVTSHASLGGQMNCETLAVTLEITGGTYVAGFPPLGTSGTFSGTLTGICSDSSGACSGSWTVQENNPAYGGSGTWNVH